MSWFEDLFIDEAKNALNGRTGGVSNWNDLIDKPFGEETVIEQGSFRWDGDTAGKVLVGPNSYNYYYCKVSDIVPPFDYIKTHDTTSAYVGSAAHTNKGANVQIITKDGQQGAYSYLGVEYTEADIKGFGYTAWFAALDAPVVSGAFGVTFPENGLYFFYKGNSYTEKISIPGYTGFSSEETVIKKIDSKYIPEILDVDTAVVNSIIEKLPTQEETINATLNEFNSQSGGVPYRQLVTNGAGEVVWEDRPYSSNSLMLVLDPERDAVEGSTDKILEYRESNPEWINNVLTTFPTLMPSGCTFVVDGVRYEEPPRRLPLMMTRGDVYIQLVQNEAFGGFAASFTYSDNKKHTFELMLPEHVVRQIDPELIPTDVIVNAVLEQIPEVPTEAELVNSVLAALPTWTGGSY